jgi:prepilin-type N-terminal cleavage/methylation domain-containing protein
VTPGAREAGFSLVEVLVAIVVLSVGMMMLAGGSLFVTRDLVRSRQATVASGLAQAQMDDLRARAAATVPRCLSAQFTSSVSPSTTSGVTISWVVPATGVNRVVRVITSYNLGRGRVRADTLAANVAC